MSETILKLCFLNEAQKEEIDEKRKYTNIEVSHLASLAYSIDKLASITRSYLTYQDSEHDPADVAPIFDIIEILINPISEYLGIMEYSDISLKKEGD